MDKIESIKKKLRHEKWQEMYESYLSSGKTVIEWCAENGISKKTFYYRLRQIRKDVIETVESHDRVSISVEIVEMHIGVHSRKLLDNGRSPRPRCLKANGVVREWFKPSALGVGVPHLLNS